MVVYLLSALCVALQIQLDDEIWCNKNAFQWDVYCLLVDCIQACTGQRVVCVPASTGQGVCVSQYALPGGMTAQGGVCLRGLVSAQGVVSAQGGVCPGVHPVCGNTPHGPVDRMADTCNNITFPQASFTGGKYYPPYFKKCKN